jgi:hypothetical protein
MRRLLVVLAALALSACATAQKLGAANDVHALLISIRDNDHAAFDAHVDHEALRPTCSPRSSSSSPATRR